MKISVIQDIVEGAWVQSSNPQRPITNLLVDSRQLHSPAQTLFFAIKGLRQDGHQFIEELYHQGVRAFIVTGDVALSNLREADIIRVKDSIKALQDIARYYRSQFDIPVIGITGSNGKTIVKEWLYHLLQVKWQVIATPKSYNSQIGVPLSVWQLTRSCNLALFEAGISMPGEMERLQAMIRPTLGIFTNLGTAHAEGFVDEEQKADEKAQLFRDCRIVVCCLDHPLVNKTLQKAGIATWTWSLHDDAADVRIEKRLSGDGFSHFSVSGFGNSFEVSIPFYDDASIENACHCIALILMMENDLTPFLQAFKTLPPIEMRLEIRTGINHCLIMNDAYSADLESLAVALSFSRQQGIYARKTCILSDIHQQALTPDELYQRVATLLDEHAFDRVLAIGDEIKHLSRFLNRETEFHFFPSVDAFQSHFADLNFENELILIKGARSYGLEVIANRLELRQHHTVLEINLAALARNLKVFETFLNPGVKIMAMVKAAAYGSGSVEIARFLSSRNIDYLAVAYADEGVELRRNGIKLPIMVLNSDASQLPLLLNYDLEPEVFSLDQLKTMYEGIETMGGELDIHLKVETGMYRLGFDEEDLFEAIKLIETSAGLRVKSVFSHLAVSESRDEDPFTRKQISWYLDICEMIGTRLGQMPIRHIVNSNGIVRHPDAQFDMVRLGIGMYGIGMPAGMDLERVHTLKTFVAQVKEVPPGATIGYGRREKVLQKTRIATLGIGYADGLIRKAGNRRYAVVIEGKLAPIVGNICMDMTMVDITDIPGVSVKTPAIIFGEDPTIEQLAMAGETMAR